MTKRALALAASTLLLAACGRQDTRTPVPLQQLVQPASAPWLTLPQDAFDVPVRGADGKVVLNPSPSVPEVLQAQLRHAAQPEYYTDLVVSCDGLKTGMRVDTPEDGPSSATLDLALHCRINARGIFTDRGYAAHPTLPVPADQNYARLFTALLDAAGKDVAGRLAADIHASRR
ncbi:hypothetical protein [Fulvimonas soli]|jgi:hypothetical protein|uniref:Lipoprotein n=1 Tax=Fulvimonas soli TaxID=155197 RepID=A0A316I473_9GAMM|nr:hypothetical protein [Fulvimonas soli]PWK87796.1 hypothetical protein C7456_106289 [Fulvimonas soli]